MKIQIRKAIFETNSSSSHSLVIRKGGTDQSKFKWFDKEGNNIVLNGGEFGWGEETFYDPSTKANYIAVGIISLLERENSKYEGERPSYKTINEYKSYKEMLTKVIKDATGCDDVIYRISTDWENPNFSYIDHQSSDEFLYALDDEETLKNFIFNSDSRLIIDNDNH